jgi:hypothetical protein
MPGLIVGNRKKAKLWNENPEAVSSVTSLHGAKPMLYALFSNDAKLSKAYPTEADVWKVASKGGLVVDVAAEEKKASPQPVLDNDTRSGPAIPSRTKILSETRLKPRATSGPNRSLSA